MTVAVGQSGAIAIARSCRCQRLQLFFNSAQPFAVVAKVGSNRNSAQWARPA
jgi:hypothetical protein